MGESLQGSVSFENRLGNITVETIPSIHGVGLAAYTRLVGIPQEQAQTAFWHHQYIVRIRAEFNRYLIGHPQMASYREWAQGVVELLEDQFDEERIWQRVVDGYILEKHLMAPGVPLAAIGPLTLAPSTGPR